MKLPKEITTVTPLSKYLAIVVLIALPIVGFFLGMQYQEMVNLAKRQEMESNLSIPRVPTPTPIAIPTIDPLLTADWKIYGNVEYGFTIKYPNNLVLEERNDYISLEFWGPTQRSQQGGHDGIFLSFRVGLLEGKTLKEFVDAEVKKIDGFSSQMIEYPRKILVGEKEGYSYKVIGSAPSTYIYLSPKPNTYFLILDVTEDPTNQGFKKTVDQILSTFKFTE